MEKTVKKHLKALKEVTDFLRSAEGTLEIPPPVRAN